MSVTSIEFLAALMFVAGIFFFLSRGFPRQLLFALCNIVFLASLIPNLTSWLALAGFILSGYFVARLSCSLPAGKGRQWIVTAYIALLLAVFAVLKEYQFLSFLIPPGSITRWKSIVGLSYMLFRQIHFVIDTSEDQIERPSLWGYLNYQFNLFTLSAGPIQRYQDFSKSWNSTAPILVDDHARLMALCRLLIGLLKVTLVGTMAQRLADEAIARQLYIREPHDIFKFATLFYAYPAYIYFNFSGYCDVVIAGAALLGMALPENFNRPFLARNMIDFWARWHMTLTYWIRDYVFTPLYKALAERRVLPSRVLSYICYFIALFLAGIWHGSSWNFAVFGLLHGAGVAVTKMWEEHIVRRKGRPGLREYLKSQPIRWSCIVLTFNFVCFTFLFFPTDLHGRAEFLRHFVLDKPAAQTFAGSVQ